MPPRKQSAQCACPVPRCPQQTVIAATHVAVSRGATQDIAYRTLRRLAVADALPAKLVLKAPPHVSNVMACAFALFWWTTKPKPLTRHLPLSIKPSTQSPRGANSRLQRVTVLRSFLRERETLLAEVQSDPVARFNSAWWIGRGKARSPGRMGKHPGRR